MSYFLKAIIYFYRICISPFFGPKCRFLPSCSEYALEAINIHGPIRGFVLSAKRISRCHPWGKHGIDPVPSKFHNESE